MARRIPIIIERHADGHVEYPVGLRGVVVSEGDTTEAARANVEGTIRFHLDTFGANAWDEQNPVLDVQIREAHVYNGPLRISTHGGGTCSS